MQTDHGDANPANEQLRSNIRSRWRAKTQPPADRQAQAAQLPLPGFRDRPFVGSSIPNKVVRWVLRVLARTEARDRCFAKLRSLEGIGELLGIDDEHRPESVGELHRIVVRRLEEAEARPPEETRPLQANIDLLTAPLGLSEAERELLEFRAQMWTQPALSELLNHVLADAWPDQQIVRIIAVAFDLRESEIWPLLDPEGPLYEAGLLWLTPATNKCFTDKLGIPFGLTNALMRPARDVEELLSFAVNRAPAATLNLDAFPHLADELSTLSQYLRAASRDRAEGVNILIHGKPGVGKTEIARALPQELGLKVYEIGIEGFSYRTASPYDLDSRLQSYRMTQALLRSVEGAVVVLDEIENALPRGSFFSEPKDSIKAWLNRLLETNPLPAFWIANDISQIDPAYVRRFDVVIEVKSPPRSVRRAILTQCLSGLPVRGSWIEHQADDPEISPAAVTRMAHVLRTLGNSETHRLEAAYETLARHQREASGVSAHRVAYPRVDGYRLEWLNVDADLAGLVEALRRRARARLLFHGPPGTGKTALAHHVAQTLDRPLLVKRASDLVSKYVGDTEKNLCAMFDEAAADDAILLLDEADSFLQDRALAQRQWEVTEVNELLTQMEAFGGLFICATNFLEHLDPAALRRFAIKLEFRPLRPDQAMSMFASHYARLARRIVHAEEITGLSGDLALLESLTPGDFAAAATRWELLDRAPSAPELLDALRAEHAVKPTGKRRPMGFRI